MGKLKGKKLSRKAKFRQELINTKPVKNDDVMDEEQEEGSDDDAPMEMTSHHGPDIMLKEAPIEEPSLFEQVEAKKKDREDTEKEKNREKRRKKRAVKKLKAGQFEVAVEKTKFKVVTLDEGVKSALAPAVNFREELLRQRTQHLRDKHSSLKHRKKWAPKV